ncbi:MAG: hypothetical protein ACI9OJ_003528 [Myxococcota bacterium]|jgi:hypothetical protein
MKILIGLALFVCAACSSDSSETKAAVQDGDVGSTDAEDTHSGVVAPHEIAASLGLTQYVGGINPEVLAESDNETIYTFDESEGPVCMRGAPFQVGVRSGTEDNLVIFLQGGGACWSDFCLAVTGTGSGIPAVDILNPELEANPVRAWNAVYLPYCDGSFFAGDAEHDDNLNGKGLRQHRGLANLTAALEVAAARFPDPPKILLAGSSGGAYGLLVAAPLVRHYYPNVELVAMADSGIGIARSGEPEFIAVALKEFNVERFIPKDCPNCLTDGHLTPMITWMLERDPNLRIGMFSSWYDSVLARTFMRITPDRFADALDQQTSAIAAQFPDRFRRFIIDGVQHTSLLANASGIIGDDLAAVELPEDALGTLLSGLKLGGMVTTEIDGLTMSTWLGGLIAGDLDVWVDVQEPRGTPPVWE